MSQNPELGIALLLNFFLGLFGADKFYVGRTDLGILQLILTITFIGLIISAPWAMICGLSLFIAIFLGGAAFMYPGVQWAPVSNRDKTIAICLLVFMLVGYMLRMSTSVTSVQYYEDTSKTKKEGCSSCLSCSSISSTRENFSSCSACSGNRSLGPYDSYDPKRRY